VDRDTRSAKQPESAEYIERLIPRFLEDSIQYAGSINFQFAQHTNEKGYTFPIPGVKTDQLTQYKIRSNASLPFKAGDIIRFGTDDKKRYTVLSIGIITESNKNYRRTFLYPQDEDKVTMKLITLN